MAHLWKTSWSALQSVASTGHRLLMLRNSRMTERAGHWRRLGLSLWSCVKRVGHTANSCGPIKLGQHKPLLVYGMAAFLWEREKIPEQEVQRVLQSYQDRVNAIRLMAPSADTDQSDSTSSTNASWFGWLSWQTQKVAKDKVEEKSSPPIDEKELRRQAIVTKLTEIYTENSERKLSQLPLVGINPKVPMKYKFGSMVVNKTRASVVSLLKQAAALTESLVNNSLPFESKPVNLSSCNAAADVSCLEYELYCHEIHGDWIPVSMDTESTNCNTLYLQVGIPKQRSKFADTLIDHPRVENSLNTFMYSSDQFLGVDCMQSQSVIYQARDLCHTLLQSTLKTVDKLLHERAHCTEDNTSSTHLLQLATEHEGDLLKSNIDYLSDWEVFIRAPSYMVFRKLYADSGLFQFKVVGTYSDITARDFFDLQFNVEDRMSWDHHTAVVKTVDFDPSSGCEVIHWVIKYPFPMSNREYVYITKRWVGPDEDIIGIISKSVDHPSVPDPNSRVRVRDYYSEMVIKAHTFIDQPGFNYELTYFDDPRVQIHPSCVNWVATSAMPEYMSKVYSAAVSRRAHTQQEVGNSSDMGTI